MHHEHEHENSYDVEYGIAPLLGLVRDWNAYDIGIDVNVNIMPNPIRYRNKEPLV
jgi:hypothetical protein